MSRSMSVNIRGIGTAVPEFEIDQADAAQQASQLCCATVAQQRLLKTLYRRAGVVKRHSVVLASSTNGLSAEQSFYSPSEIAADGPTTARRMEHYDRHAAPLAVEACRRAIEDAQIDLAQIENLVTVSCSGFFAPGVDLAILRELQLKPSTTRSHIGFMGCHGAFNGLRVAKSFAAASPGSCVLLCAVELCTLHHQYGWEPDQLVANSLFGDGAAAVVLQADTNNSQERHLATVPADQKNTDWCLTEQRSTVIPDTAELMSWRIDDHGFQMSLSPQLPGVIDRTLRPWLESWLGELSLSIDEIASWAIHPGGPRIIEACAQAIGPHHASLAESLTDSLAVLAEYGNMSSPTVLFILERLRRRAAPRPCVALAFGPGIAIEAALFR
ncbi:MAG TPA: type III polyketide synthase [Pirellulales bacterium]|jgi:predicted naringenin-chalcone synthase